MQHGERETSRGRSSAALGEVVAGGKVVAVPRCADQMLFHDPRVGLSLTHMNKLFVSTQKT